MKKNKKIHGAVLEKKKTERLFTESIDAACEERLVFPSTSNQSYSS